MTVAGGWELRAVADYGYGFEGFETEVQVLAVDEVMEIRRSGRWGRF